MSASSQGHPESIERLLAAGAAVDVADPESRQTALMHASIKGHPESIERLLAAGAAVDVACAIGRTALSYASDAGCVDGVAKLQALPKEGKPRTAIVTQGSLPALIATADGVTEHPVLPCDNLVDTNGAGDAWVGGFLYGTTMGKDTAECVKSANYAANHIIQRSGCTMADKPDAY